MKRKKIHSLLIIFMCCFLLCSCHNGELSAINQSFVQAGFNQTETQVEIGEQPVANDDSLEKEEVSIVMVGDVLLHAPINKGALQEDGSYQYEHLFQNVKAEIEEADIAMVNQEVIIGGAELGVTGYPAFNAPYEIADALVDAGFDVILHGTNHALDKGEKGIANCLVNWKKKYPQIKITGIHDSQESQDEICYIEKNGIKIAVLNYTYGTNGISVPKGKEYLVDYLQENDVRDDIKRAKAESDFVIVCPHWGTEYSHEISSDQKKWTQLFLEEGVDLVIGTHPHVIEPIELLQADGKQMLVYYSLGNFINCTSGSGIGTSDRMVGGMAEITLARNDGNDEVEIKEYSVKPLITQMAFGKNEITTYFLDDYTEEMAQCNEVKKRDSHFSYQYCITIAKDIFQDNWK